MIATSPVIPEDAAPSPGDSDGAAPAPVTPEATPSDTPEGVTPEPL